MNTFFIALILFTFILSVLGKAQNQTEMKELPNLFKKALKILLN